MRIRPTFLTVALLLALCGCDSGGGYFGGTEIAQADDIWHAYEWAEIYTDRQLYRKIPDPHHPLPWDEPRLVIPGSEVSFDVWEKSVLTINGHIGVENLRLTETGSCCVSVDIVIDDGSGYARIIGSNVGENVPRQRHYWVVPLHGRAILDPGTYTIAVRGRSYSSDLPDYDGLAQTKDWNYSVIDVEVEVLK